MGEKGRDSEQETTRDEAHVELPGQVVFKRGDPGGSIFIVVGGAVEIFVEDTIGQRVVFETAKAGDFFGELSLLDGDPRSASAVALEPTRTVRLDRGDLELLFKRHPTAAMDVLSTIGKRLVRRPPKLTRLRKSFRALRVQAGMLNVRAYQNLIDIRRADEASCAVFLGHSCAHSLPQCELIDGNRLVSR